jgi:hypothetical protein
MAGVPAHMIWNRFSFSNFLNTAEGQFAYDTPDSSRTPFDLDKLVADQQREERVVV